MCSTVLSTAASRASVSRLPILASGSSGQHHMLETERTRLLIDAGLGKRETLARLAAVERTVEHIDGILITHEHTDHCKRLAANARSVEGAALCHGAYHGRD